MIFQIPSLDQDPKERKDEEIQRMENTEELKENDLIVPENDDVLAKDILASYGIGSRTRPYVSRLRISKETWQPAEFIITILNENDKDESFENVKKVFELLRSKGVVIRYAHNPEKAAEEAKVVAE